MCIFGIDPTAGLVLKVNGNAATNTTAVGTNYTGSFPNFGFGTPPGNLTGGQYFFPVQALSEALVWPYSLNGATNIDNVSSYNVIEGYFAHKWGLTGSLPIGHPYKVNPPPNGTFII